MSAPQVSVICTSYNRRVMVLEALRSVLAQRGAAFELIVVDDGSTDGSPSEIERLAAQVNAGQAQVAMRLIGATVNRGVAAARNAGVKIASAPWIAFIDSDDLWWPDKLRRQLDFVRQDPATVLVQTEEWWQRDGRGVNPGWRHRKRAGEIFIDSLRTCLISPSAVMMRTDLFRAMGGFDETLIAAEDYDLWLRILAEYPAGLIDEPLVTRRAGHPGQLSGTVPALDRFRIVTLLKLLMLDHLSASRRRATGIVLAEKCLIYAKGLTRRGHREAAAFVNQIALRSNSWMDGPDSRLDNALKTARLMIAIEADREPAGPRPAAQRA